MQTVVFIFMIIAIIMFVLSVVDFFIGARIEARVALSWMNEDTEKKVKDFNMKLKVYLEDEETGYKEFLGYIDFDN